MILRKMEKIDYMQLNRETKMRRKNIIGYIIIIIYLGWKTFFFISEFSMFLPLGNSKLALGVIGRMDVLWYEATVSKSLYVLLMNHCLSINFLAHTHTPFSF